MSVRFAGYAAVFDAVDRGGDVVRAGAFGPVGPVPLLWQQAASRSARSRRSAKMRGGCG